VNQKRSAGEREPTTSTTMSATALNVLSSGEGPAGVVKLVVLGTGLPVTHALAADAEVVIGRSDQADVKVDEESISRRHAILRIGDNITLEDLGSLNGSRVRDRALRKGDVAAIVPGEAFEIGKVMCIVQRKSGEKKPGRGLRPHSYVEARIDEEIERRADGAAGVSLARLHVEGTLPTGVLEEAIGATLTPNEICGDYGPGELEVVFLDTAPADVERRCDSLALALRRHAKVRVGIAAFPRDGRNAAALLESANDLVRGDRETTGSSAVKGVAMERLRGLVQRVAASDISIVLYGETGVGKEVLAREIHKLSDRATKPFVGLNCAALTETLLESELFGHERGAFSGAVTTKPGLLEVAEEGTVFLDEIGEMSLSIQAKLLRVIEERQVLRVGGLSPRAIDVRFLSASHRDLEHEVEAQRFRQDLYFRLNGITLDIPPLRERVEEIEGLARGFLLEACRRQKRLDTPRFGTEALDLLKQYAWPGNVRELRNVVERAVLLCAGSAIRAEHLPAERMLAHKRVPRVVRLDVPHTSPGAGQFSGLEDSATLETKNGVRTASNGDERPTTGPQAPVSLKGAVEEIEREKILDALRLCAGNQTKAAQMLGISRRTLLNRLDQYGLPRPRKPNE
jgi:two-component system response regulator AtoC